MHAFTILSDPVRRKIVVLLLAQAMSSGEIVETVGEEFNISQSAISQHLKILRENRFANVRVDGSRRIYSLDTSGLQDIDEWLTPFRQYWEPKFEALANEVRRGKKKQRK